MPKFLDLTGKRFGRLVVLKRASKPGDRVRWLCKCDCGVKKEVRGYNITSGHTKSCGCLNKEIITKHGYYKKGKESKIYVRWVNMIQRCADPKNTYYYCYGNRGIMVCERWMKFENFLEDMGEPPTDKHQIDRIDNDGNYCKSNCHWVTSKINNRNKRNNRLITYKGKTQCLAEWAEQFDIDYYTLKWRLNNGWSIEKALTTPSRKKVEYVNTYL